MNVILRKAKDELRTAATIADAMADGEVTIGEILKVKFKGLMHQFDLRAFIPTMEMKTIKRFEELSEAEMNFLTDGEDLPARIVKAAYDAAVASYEVVFLMVEEVNEDTELPAVPTDKTLLDVDGVGPATAEILENLGVKSVEILASSNVEDVAAGLKGAGAHPATVAKAGMFVESAKSILTIERSGLDEGEAGAEKTDSVETETTKGDEQ